MAHLFYSPAFSEKNHIISPEESWHAVKVLRLKNGENVRVTDGKGSLFECRILKCDEKKTELEILSFQKEEKRNFYIHLAIAPTKNIDRIEWMLEKCVEIGIEEITFLLCERSERKQLRMDRMEKIAVEALKQSFKGYLPRINELISFENFIRTNKSNQKFVCHLEDSDRKVLSKTAFQKDNYCILIGPEGDFSPKEIGLAVKNDYLPVTLGESRLRTETAGLVACHTLNLINE